MSCITVCDPPWEKITFILYLLTVCWNGQGNLENKHSDTQISQIKYKQTQQQTMNPKRIFL